MQKWRGGAAEPLVGYGRSLVARAGDGRVTYDRIDCVAVIQRMIESDAGAERLDGLVAGVSERGRRLEGDPGSAIAEGEVGGMAEAQRGGEVETSAENDRSLVTNMGADESGGEVDTGTVGVGYTDRGDGDGFAVGRGTDGQLIASQGNLHRGP